MYMITMLSKKLSLLLLAGSILAACTSEAPYIYNPNEFNREKKGFAKEIKDRAQVQICYNKRSTSPKMLQQMAIDECRRFGKQAIFKQQKNLVCSISAPAQIIYKCFDPNAPIEEER
jgi:hypothetical protein